jgi:hypothetical protein
MVIAMLFALSVRADDLTRKLDLLLAADDGKEQEKIITEILKQKPSPDTLIALLKGIKFPAPDSTGIIRGENLCIDGVKRPFYWFVPKNYNPAKKTPLLVCIHGGVMRPEITDKPEDLVYPAFMDLANETGYIMLFPAGEAKAAWWDSVGAANVLAQIRATKRKFNIDDNRVFMSGFSDGGSGSFFFAMCYPTDFAAFMPLNGHSGVGSIDGGIQMYYVNLFNRPLSVVNTDLDQLYPDKEIRPMMALAQRAGANLLYRIYTGIGHDFAYAPKELPLMVEFMETHPRSVSPPEIKWETAYPELGRCMWLAIESIRAGFPAQWYQDQNMELVNDRVMFGFVADDKYKGLGVRIGKIVGDSTFCALVGVQEGDVIIELGKKPIIDMKDIAAYKTKKKCGDSAEMTVLRDGKTLNFSGRFPGPTRYPLFKRGSPSARAEASFLANRFTVRGSQLGAFSIYIDPAMVQLDQNLIVVVDGKEVFNKKVNADPKFILDNFLENRDRELLYVNRIAIK